MKVLLFIALLVNAPIEVPKTPEKITQLLEDIQNGLFELEEFLVATQEEPGDSPR